jgi:hypothetical protein
MRQNTAMLLPLRSLRVTLMDNSEKAQLACSNKRPFESKERTPQGEAVEVRSIPSKKDAI